MVIPITDEREKERFNEIIDTGSEFRILNEYAENVLNIGKYEYSYNSIEKKLSVSMPLSLENIEYVIKKYLQRENSVNINKKNECHEIVFEDKLYEYDVMLEGKCYGIDLGTTYSCISKYENGEVKIIADEEGGSDLLASAVFVKDDGNELIIGEGAKEEGVLAPERLFQFFKRWIGKDPETEPDYKHYIVDGKEYTPVELSSLVLKRIKEYAKKAGEEVEDVIITCPAYFDFAQRELTKKAGELAGLNVLAVINEPMAVAISYSNEEYLKSQNVLVYDLGGGTFDVTLLKIDIDSNEKKIDVIATDGDAFLGGADWDNEMHKLLIEKYREQFGVAEEDIDEELKEMLRSVTEKLKQKLTMQTTVTYKTKYDGERIQLEISREEFDERTKDLLVKTEWLLNSILKKVETVGIKETDTDVVLEVGGSTRMPQVQNSLSERFGDKVRFYEPDKAVARGAAIVGAQGVIAGNMRMPIHIGHLYKYTSSISDILDNVRTLCDLLTKMEIAARRINNAEDKINIQYANTMLELEDKNDKTMLRFPIELENLYKMQKKFFELDKTSTINAN